MRRYIFFLLGLMFIAPSAHAQNLDITMYRIDENGTGAAIGTVTVSTGMFGTVLTPDLKELSPGLHGFHLHTNPSCQAMEKDGRIVPGLAAGGHYDPDHSNAHLGPYANGHMGDLPALYVDKDGNATLPVLAPRLKQSDFKGKSLIIHAGGDNYSDEPAKLGGGGPRLACGILQ